MVNFNIELKNPLSFFLKKNFLVNIHHMKKQTEILCKHLYSMEGMTFILDCGLIHKRDNDICELIFFFLNFLFRLYDKILMSLLIH